MILETNVNNSISYCENELLNTIDLLKHIEEEKQLYQPINEVLEKIENYINKALARSDNKKIPLKAASTELAVAKMHAPKEMIHPLELIEEYIEKCIHDNLSINQLENINVVKEKLNIVRETLSKKNAEIDLEIDTQYQKIEHLRNTILNLTTETTENLRIFRKRLKTLRGEKSLQEAAQDLGISRATLGYYENGDRKPDIEILLKIAKYYKVSSDYLLGLTEYSTVDINNRSISELTGLNEDAVETLCRLNHFDENELKSYFIPTLNLLLSSSCNLIHQIAGFLNFNFDIATEIKYKESGDDYDVTNNQISLDAFALFDTKHSIMFRTDSELLNQALLVNIQNELVKLRKIIQESKIEDDTINQ